MDKVRTGLIKILNSWVGVIFFIIALFFLHCPQEFEIIPFVYRSETIVRLFVIAVLVISLIIIDGNIKTLLCEEKILWACVAWGIIVVIATAVNGGIVANALWSRTTLLFALTLLIAVFFKVNLKKYLFIVFIYCLIITTLNNVCAFYFLNRGGMWAQWGGPALEGRILVGNVNCGSNFAFVAALAGGIYAYKYNKYWDIVNVVNMVFCLLMAIKTESRIQIIGYILVLVLIGLTWISKHLPKSRNILKWLNAKTLVVFDSLLFIFLVPLKSFGVFDNSGFYNSLAGRSAIWKTAIADIVAHPILGGNPYRSIQVITNGAKRTWAHTHSLFLQVPYETGFVGLAFYIIIVLVCIPAISSIENFQLRFFAGAMLGIFFFIMIMDLNFESFIFLCYGIFYYGSRQILKEEQKCGLL